MEKVKFNYKKFALMCLPIVILTWMVLVLIGIASITQIYPAILSFLFFISYVALLESKKNDLIFLSKEGIHFYLNSKEKKLIAWSNVKVTRKYLLFNDINITFSDSIIEKKIRINFFHAESLISLTKKYCPHDNQFYKTIEEFAVKKKMKF